MKAKAPAAGRTRQGAVGQTEQQQLTAPAASLQLRAQHGPIGRCVLGPLNSSRGGLPIFASLQCHAHR
jgi:hypothetical protein